MATNKPHVKLNTLAQYEGSFDFRYKSRYSGSDEENEDDAPVVKNYKLAADEYRASYARFRLDVNERRSRRNPALNIPAHLEYIRIHFHSQFDNTYFFRYYWDHYGLEAVNFSKFGTIGLFAVIDRAKANNFLQITNSFAVDVSVHPDALPVDNNILFIKSFELLTTDFLIQDLATDSNHVALRLADFPLETRFFNPILIALEEYLRIKHIDHHFNYDSRFLEISGIDPSVLTELLDNYDIVISVTSSLSTVIGPTAVGTPRRSYGFSVIPSGDDLPIIGVIDTGISVQTPLASILINDQSFDLTGTGSFIDNADHGTAVAALAALGKKPYSLGYRGNIVADARLLSIKVMDTARAPLSITAVLGAIHRAKTEYPQIKLFVLTIGFDHHKLDDEDFSTYAAELDRFCYENDCLIFISVANNNSACDDNTDYNYNYFSLQKTNLCVPAESMNNVTVGAASDNITGNLQWAISPGKEYPVLYTRKHHADIRHYYPRNRNNKHYFKPDVIECGGDYERSGNFIGQDLNASIEVLSANQTQSFYKQIGTSFSAPLVANLGARILQMYPTLRAQSIKALIINGASDNLIHFPPPVNKLKQKVVGNGLVNDFLSLVSSDNSVTFIIEDEILPGKIKLFPIQLPDYLYDGTVNINRAILKFTATLCFSFSPYTLNHLCYCPVHIGYTIFRNVDEKAIREEYSEARLRNSWSQDAFYRKKPIPFSNSQKMSFVVGKNDIMDESGTFKLAVSCKLNPQLIPGNETHYQIPHKFSLAIRIEENQSEVNLTGRLYNELISINQIENIAVTEIELENSLELF